MTDRRTLVRGSAVAALLGAFGAMTMPIFAKQPDAVRETLKPGPGEKEIFLAGGCFWGTEHFMRQIAGVIAVESGYANSRVPNPSYREVCSGLTGAVETVHVVYDPTAADLAFLLGLFFRTIDPTAVNRQGNDRGTQYRSGIYFSDPADEPVIREQIAALAAKYDDPIATEAKRLENFYRAEDYHQQYLIKNPRGYCHIEPELFEQARTARMSPELQKFVNASDAELRNRLTELQYRVTQQCGTEPPFRNEYWDEHRPGIYVDITNGEPLFSSSDKFDSGTGWPSFVRPIRQGALRNTTDRSYGMLRTEVKAAGSGSHLGHVFRDGPADRGGLRYCMNSASLRFIPKQDMERLGYGAYLKYVK